MSTTPHINSNGPGVSRSSLGKVPATIGLIFLFLIPTVLIVKFLRTGASHLLTPGDHVPILTFSDLDSTTFDEPAFNGRLTALLFFSAECPHCIREIITFDRLRKRFGDRITFVAISASDRLKTARVLSANQITVPTVFDQDEGGRKSFGVDIVPALFLVDSDGIVAYGESGEKNYAVRERLLLRFLHPDSSAKE